MPSSCSTYYKCSNSASYGFCCPPGTRFNANTCGCSEDETCTDACVLIAPAATTVQPAQVFADRCIDSFGSTLLPHESDPSKYRVWDEESQSSQVIFFSFLFLISIVIFYLGDAMRVRFAIRSLSLSMRRCR